MEETFEIKDGRRFFNTFKAPSKHFSLSHCGHYYTTKIGDGLFVDDNVPGAKYLIRTFVGNKTVYSEYVARGLAGYGGYGISLIDPGIPFVDRSPILDCYEQYKDGLFLKLYQQCY